MQIVSAEIIKQLKKRIPNSHKGENGIVLVVAGSDKYHGALLFAIKAVSRIADIVLVHSVARNLKIIKKLKTETGAFISVKNSQLKEAYEKSDVILIGPGLEESKNNQDLLENILTKNKNKKVVIDATSLLQLKPEWLNQNCIITPHHREFEKVFGVKATPQKVLAKSSEYGCVILLKGPSDYISDGNIIYENQTGNAGMTKGGTGDVLAGLVAGFYCQNSALTSAMAAAYLNGAAGDSLYEKKNTFYNAEDLIEELGDTYAKLIK